MWRYNGVLADINFNNSGVFAHYEYSKTWFQGTLQLGDIVWSVDPEWCHIFCYAGTPVMWGHSLIYWGIPWRQLSLYNVMLIRGLCHYWERYIIIHVCDVDQRAVPLLGEVHHNTCMWLNIDRNILEKLYVLSDLPKNTSNLYTRPSIHSHWLLFMSKWTLRFDFINHGKVFGKQSTSYWKILKFYSLAAPMGIWTEIFPNKRPWGAPTDGRRLRKFPVLITNYMPYTNYFQEPKPNFIKIIKSCMVWYDGRKCICTGVIYDRQIHNIVSSKSKTFPNIL